MVMKNTSKKVWQLAFPLTYFKGLKKFFEKSFYRKLNFKTIQGKKFKPIFIKILLKP